MLLSAVNNLIYIYIFYFIGVETRELVLTVVTQDLKICNGRTNDFGESCLRIFLPFMEETWNENIYFIHEWACAWLACSCVLWSPLQNSSCIYFIWLANIKALNERKEGKVVANSVRKVTLLQMEKSQETNLSKKTRTRC